MNGILDLDNNLLTSLSFALFFLADKEFDVKVQCQSGVSLRSINGANVFYFGRFDSGDPWTDLEADGLDLSTFAPNLKVIHIKVETDSSVPKQQATRLYLL